ncbi:hypothetical protein [Neorhodopirellula lusitana]|uniref:hypothetical protein n=1 Tax=Neorhodopirellula lusitana TaxID=445327 RepID=UPI0038513F82
MPDSTASEIAAMPWCDATFLGFHWQKDRETPTLILHLSSNQQPEFMLACVWACRLTVELDYGRSVGPLLTFDPKFTSLQGNRWSVHVDLPPQGYLKLECNDLRLVPVA